MNRTALFLVASLGFYAAGVRAESTPAAANDSAQQAAATASADAPAVVQVPATSATTPPVTQVVYTPQLPSAADLTTAAAAQGFTVEKIVQTSGQVIAFYKNANGQPTTVAYQSLPPAGTVTTPVATPTTAAPTPARVVVTAPPTIVYESAPRVVYYDYPRYYSYPRIWYPPVSVGIGFGFRSYHGGHFHRGHFHGHHHRR